MPDPPYEPETRNISISDPSLVALFGGAPALAGVTVSEQTVLGIPAVWRAVSLIAGSIAALPLHTITTNSDGTSQRTASWLDDPGRVIGLTAYQWKETVLTHLLLHGNCYLRHVYGGAGQLLGLEPIHPASVGVDVDKRGSRTYKVSLLDGRTAVYTTETLTHIPALSTDGLRGWSPLQVAKNTFGTAIAADRSAARLFGNGALMSAIATPEDDLSPDDAEVIKEKLTQRLGGGDNAGSIAVINRRLKITPWSLSAEDSQWIQARAFQIEEVARWFGVPPHLLAQTEKQTSWGSGVESQNRGLARYVLEPWTTRLQERLSWLLEGDRKCEFFYSAFIEPDPETEIRLLIEQVKAGLLTVDEARKVRNMPPLPKGAANGEA